MWPFDQTIVAVDARSVAVIVQRDVLGRRSVLRFEAAARQGTTGEEPLRGVAEAAIDDARRLVRNLEAPVSRLSVVLPVGAAFPAIVATGDGRWVDFDELLRFRLSSLAPFPMHETTVAYDRDLRTQPGHVFAEVLPKAQIEAALKLAAALGCEHPRIHSGLGAALRAFQDASSASSASVVDLILGDAAYAVAERADGGALMAVTTRFLTDGADRIERALHDAATREPAPSAIRVAGPGAPTARSDSGPKIESVFADSAAAWPVLRLASA